jgi:hypothetical protein
LSEVPSGPTGGEPENSFPLALQEMAAMVRPRLPPEPPLLYPYRDIGPTLARRLRSLARQETRSLRPRITDPTWSPHGPIPGLIVAQRRAGGDAFGCAHQIADLDMAFRRAATLIELLLSGEQVHSWPIPVRPERGGLWLLDSRYGSFDALWSFYGTLVSVATSTPVSLASFASLAWNSGKYGYQKTTKWLVHRIEPAELADRPSANDSLPSTVTRVDTWQERTTKRLMPLLKQAVDDGYGLDFRATGPNGELRFIITPTASTVDSTDNAS